MTDPHTDREWLIKLSGQIDTLTGSIDRLADKLVDIEKTQIAELSKRINILDAWRQQINGGWKLAVILWVVSTVGVGIIFKLISK